MFIFNKPLIFYLSSRSLEVFSNNNNQKFIFPPEIVQHGEVVDKNKFVEALSQFLSQLNLKKGKGVIVLSPKMVFSGQVNSSEQSATDPVEQFLSSVPLARDTISSITIKTKNYETIYATNRQFYEILVNTLSQRNIEIYSVVPITAFQDISDTTELNIEVIKKKIGNKQIVTAYNFLQTKHSVGVHSTTDNPNNENANKNMRNQYIMLLLSLLLLAGTITFFLLWSETITNPWFKKDKGISPKATLLPTPTVEASAQLSPTVKSIDKSALRIQILNGSGIEGQAAKLSQLLLDNGYKNIDTGNAPQISSESSVLYDKSLPVNVIDELISIIKQDLSNIEAQEATKSSEYNAVITTGRYK